MFISLLIGPSNSDTKLERVSMAILELSIKNIRIIRLGITSVPRKVVHTDHYSSSKFS